MTSSKHRSIACSTLLLTLGSWACLASASSLNQSYILHTVDGKYDLSWLPRNVSSATELRTLLSPPSNADVASLVAFLDDTVPMAGDAAGRSCAAGYRDERGKLQGFHPILLRHGQRYITMRHMRILTVYRSRLGADWSSAWPMAEEVTADAGGCGLVIFGARMSLPAAGDAAAWGKLQKGDRMWFAGPQGFGSQRAGLNIVQNVVEGAKRAPRITFVRPPESDGTVVVSWIPIKGGLGDADLGEETEVAQLSPGHSSTISSFIGHSFSFRRRDDRSLLGFATVAYAGESITVADDMLQYCAVKAHDAHVATQRAAAVSKAAAAATGDESEAMAMAMAMDDDAMWKLREHFLNLGMESRLALSDVQVHFTPQMTKDGFAKARLPPALFHKVLDFYKTHYESDLSHVESHGGPLYNQRTVPTYHTPLPPKMRETVFEDLKVMMQDWAGGITLKGTSCYGIRTYTRGSYLHLHVDTANTHVISGILNVNQSVTTDWPLEILDLNGKLHSVTMAPGDLVFYESARLLHGRPHPLDGDSYANVFVHYMPENWEVPL